MTDNQDRHRQDRKRPTSSKKVKVAQRTCLRCKKTFKSEWIGNRMCPPCIRAGDFMLLKWEK